MNDELKSQISAFVDGELPDNETELLLRRLSQHAELRAQVASYLAIGRAIRGEHAPSGMPQLRQRILAELGEAVADTEPAADFAPSRIMRPLVGVAVAASVALIALVGLRQVGTGVDGTGAVIADRDAVVIDQAPSYTEPPAAEFLANRPSDRLAIYDRRHRAGSADLESLLVSFEARGAELGDPEEEETAERDDVTDSMTTDPGQ